MNSISNLSWLQILQGKGSKDVEQVPRNLNLTMHVAPEWNNFLQWVCVNQLELTLSHCTRLHFTSNLGCTPWGTSKRKAELLGPILVFCGHCYSPGTRKQANTCVNICESCHLLIFAIPDLYWHALKSNLSIKHHSRLQKCLLIGCNLGD